MMPSFKTTMFIIQLIMKMKADFFHFHPDYFDKIMGMTNVREALSKHLGAQEIIDQFCTGLEDFGTIRESHLLY